MPRATPPNASRITTSMAVALASCASTDQNPTAPLVEELLVVRVPFAEEAGEVQATLRSRWDRDRPDQEHLVELECGVTDRFQLGADASFRTGGEQGWTGVGVEGLVSLFRSERRVVAVFVEVGLEADRGSTLAAEQELEASLAILYHERWGRHGVFVDLGPEAGDGGIGLRYGAAAVESLGPIAVVLELAGILNADASTARFVPGIILPGPADLELGLGVAVGAFDEAGELGLVVALTAEF